MMKDRVGDYMQCFSGGLYWPLDPRVDEIYIQDIAHSLSLQCRYTGHCNKFYSVAEHSIHVSNIVPPEHALAGLLHDATEAYLTDVARPVKRYLTNYQDIEAMNWFCIACRFGLNQNLPEIVHEADTAMLHVERAALMKPRPEKWVGDGRLAKNVVIRCWSPPRAEGEFMRRFHELWACPASASA